MVIVTSKASHAFAAYNETVRTTWLKAQDAVVVAKPGPGFDHASIETIARLLRDIHRGEHSALKFLVFEFAEGGAAATTPSDAFADLVAATADLIVDTPVVTLAWARGLMEGLDFDFAMNCSAIVAETGARFSFSGSLSICSGFMRRSPPDWLRQGRTPHRQRQNTHRRGSAQSLLVKEVVAAQPDYSGMVGYLGRLEHHYNASHAIFRAQRMAEPPIDRRPVDVTERRSVSGRVEPGGVGPILKQGQQFLDWSRLAVRKP